jgi:hypothetical protein
MGQAQEEHVGRAAAWEGFKGRIFGVWFLIFPKKTPEKALGGIVPRQAAGVGLVFREFAENFL